MSGTIMDLPEQPSAATFLVYRPATGVVTGRRFNHRSLVRIGLATDAELLEVPEDSPAIAGRLETFYVQDDVIFTRTEPVITVSNTSFAADGLAECTIAGIPLGAKAILRGAVTAGPVQIDDGDIVITSTSAGMITVTLDCPPPYLRWEGQIHAV